MDVNEITTNNENIETIVEETGFNSGKGLKTVIGIGLCVGMAGLGYKYVVKPIIKKVKGKKEEMKQTEDVVDINKVNDDDCYIDFDVD